LVRLVSRRYIAYDSKSSHRILQVLAALVVCLQTAAQNELPPPLANSKVAPQHHSPSISCGTPVIRPGRGWGMTVPRGGEMVIGPVAKCVAKVRRLNSPHRYLQIWPVGLEAGDQNAASPISGQRELRAVSRDLAATRWTAQRSSISPPATRPVARKHPFKVGGQPWTGSPSTETGRRPPHHSSDPGSVYADAIRSVSRGTSKQLPSGNSVARPELLSRPTPTTISPDARASLQWPREVYPLLEPSGDEPCTELLTQLLPRALMSERSASSRPCRKSEPDAHPRLHHLMAQRIVLGRYLCKNSLRRKALQVALVHGQLVWAIRQPHNGQLLD
jgi:hypothetical protein